MCRPTILVLAFTGVLSACGSIRKSEATGTTGGSTSTAAVGSSSSPLTSATASSGSASSSSPSSATGAGAASGASGGSASASTTAASATTISSSGSTSTASRATSSSSIGTGSSTGTSGSTGMVCDSPTGDCSGVDAGVITTCDASPLCNSMTGLGCPLAACSASSPCDDVNPGMPVLTSPLTAPLCKTIREGRKFFDDSVDGGPTITWNDSVDGTPRAACAYVPPSATRTTPVPLVIYTTGSLGSADDIYDYLSLRVKAPSFSLAADPKLLGFALVSVQPRNLHWLANGNPDGPHEDYVFRDVGSDRPNQNPDVRGVDDLVDLLVATGKVNPQRIYITGWSNGALFAQFYAVLRHSHPTPGGNSIAAAAIYAGADPFNNEVGATPSCKLATYPSTDLPLYVLHRDCDALMACNAEQQVAFANPPGIDMNTWVHTTLEQTMGDSAVTDQILTGKAASTPACADLSECSFTVGFENHTHWPDGIDDMSGNDWEPAMLNFLKANPSP